MTSTLSATFNDLGQSVKGDTVATIEYSSPSERQPATIDELIRFRAAGEHADSPIIAYPPEGLEYVYYSPREVRYLRLVTVMHQLLILYPG